MELRKGLLREWRSGFVEAKNILKGSKAYGKAKMEGHD